MKTKSIYTQLFTTKTNHIIPVLENGKTVESRYNPVVEAQRKIEQIQSLNHFIIVIGLASGIIVEELLKKNQNCRILVVEREQTDYDFLSQIKTVENLLKNKNIIFSNPKNLYNDIISNYIPAFYGNIEILENNIWAIENKETISLINGIIQIANEDILKDYSVQSHFGKIWQKNIFSNLKICSENKLHCEIEPNKKTAVIVAAGPSLDQSISILENSKEEYFVIATDTAWQSLRKRNIKTDCVISIDGQNISTNHFLVSNKDSKEKPFIIFDLTANSNAARHLINQGYNLFYCINNHPLSNFINAKNNNCFINLDSGSGTVTIAALDFALKIGFEKIKVLGADFAYINRKTYTKSTYLENQFSIVQNKINSIDKSYSKLMFRTPLINENNKLINTVLKSYEKSFCEFLEKNNCTFIKENNIYEISTRNKIINKFHIKQSCNYSETVNEFRQICTENHTVNSIFELKNEYICLLPLISWLRNNDDIKEGSFSDYLKEAFKLTQRYL